ncbi:MAG: alpha/beta hydrolase [Acidobacteriia bacterium]|nr:alpha/beta hydrolase [Terriglobia bacterium]
MADKPRKRWKKILKWTLIVLLLGVASFFLVYVPYFFAHVVTRGRYHYRDKDDGQTPATYNVAYRDIEFQTSDHLLLKGWFVPADHPRGTVVYVHGLNRTRIELLRQAMFIHHLGYNGILFDERHEGASEGTITTMGYFERYDVEAAVRKALELDPAARPIIVWGISMGAAASLEAAAETPAIDAVICDSTFLTLRDTTYHHLKLFMHLPKFPTAMTTLLFFEHFAHFNADDFDLQKAVQRIGNRPILFVAGGNDNRMPPSIARHLFFMAQSGYKMFLEVPGARHGESFRTNPKLYEDAVVEFLGRVQESVGPAENRSAR